MSVRAIASATGSSTQTIQRDSRSGVVNHYTSDARSELSQIGTVAEPQVWTNVHTCPRARESNDDEVGQIDPPEHLPPRT